MYRSTHSESATNRDDNNNNSNNSNDSKNLKEKKGKVIGRHKFDQKYETDKNLPINAADVTGELLPLKYPWGTVFSARIVCMVISMWPERKAKWDVCLASRV